MYFTCLLMFLNIVIFSDLISNRPKRTISITKHSGGRPTMRGRPLQAGLTAAAVSIVGALGHTIFTKIMAGQVRSTGCTFSIPPLLTNSASAQGKTRKDSYRLLVSRRDYREQLCT